jgi:hypothetical protein
MFVFEKPVTSSFSEEDPEDGGNKLLENVWIHLPKYMAAHPRRT